ncbi:aldo/keto reductase [Candidatus Poriferisocius sp.]|uniref:aldo/keto reductase n=1 Tax=Candidatus Poriferisocius sp. TaxID=3101276 RepID=UPI003B01407D
MKLATTVIPPFGLGTAPLGGLYENVSHDEGVATVLAALDAGYEYLDTAPLYGYGRAESIVGDALRHAESMPMVSTKVGRLLDHTTVRPTGDMFAGAVGAFQWDFSASGVRRSLESSLDRLGLDRVDVAFIHDPDRFADQALAEAYPEMEALRSEGLVGLIGIGMNEPQLPTRFVRDTDIDVMLIAGRYTLLDRSAAEELLPEAIRRGVHVIAAGVYNSGILTGDEATPHFDYAPAPQKLVERTDVLACVCDRFGTKLRTAAVQFPSRHPAVDTVLVGARSPLEAAENLQNFTAAVPHGLWGVLETVSVD